MASQRCDACGEKIRIGGGIGDVWNVVFGSRGSTAGMTLELSDGSEHFLCFDCVERLPEDRELTAADVEAIAAEGPARED